MRVYAKLLGEVEHVKLREQTLEAESADERRIKLAAADLDIKYAKAV